MSLYKDEVIWRRRSVFGNSTETKSLAQMRSDSEMPLLRVWENDDELQFLQIASTNIGFVYEYQKQFATRARRQR